MAAAAAAVLLMSVLREHRGRAALQLALLIGAFGCFALGCGLSSTPLGVTLIAGSLAAMGSLAPSAAAHLAHARGSSATAFAAQSTVPLALAGAWVAAPALRGWLIGASGGWALAGAAHAAQLLVKRALSAVERVGELPDRTRLRYLAIAHTLIPFAALFDLVAWHFGKPRLATFVATLICFYVGYLHLARLPVKDLGQLMGNAVGLTFMAAGLTAAFSSLWLWGGPRLDVFVFNAFVASFVMLIFLQPLRAQIQVTLDRRFVASKLELERAFAPLRERLAQILTLDEFFVEVLDTCESTMRLRASAIFLREDPHGGFQLAASFGLPPRSRVHLIEAPTWTRVLEADRVLQRDDLERGRSAQEPEPHAAEAEALLDIMDDLGAQLVLPLCSESQLVGFWTLADRSLREAFSTREIELLHGVAQLMARSVENSKSFARIRARDRLAMVGEMSAGLAHEIRNPLATIRGAVSLLETAEPAEAADIRRMIVEEISRLDRLVDTFLNYARPSLDQAPIADLGGFVRSCAAEVEHAQAPSAVELQLAIEPDLPSIRANPDHLERVLQNVLKNAYEALEGRSHGRIELAVRRAASEPGGRPAVEIAIEDNGRGMDARTLERAFIPFFTTKATGTGLGLPLCERLVRAQGGELHVHSVPGERTQVRIRLPLDPEPVREKP